MSAAKGLRLTVPVRGRRVLVVGGGGTALRRVTRLVLAGAAVELVAPAAEAALEDLAQREQVVWHRRDWCAGDLAGAWLVVAATDDAQADAAVARESDAAGVWSIGSDHDALDPAPAPGTRSSVLKPGTVTLVGGGPGDAGLITVAGLRAVQAADVVVVDRLAPLGILDGLDRDVEIVDVSKIPRGRFTPQEDINAVLVAKARSGQRVVRLKGGDPYVFGRGMEEALACAEAGIPVEVIPGVTSAVAGPGLAGIPVTHRGLSQGFTVVSGHVPPGDERSTLNWAALATGGTTLVLLMAVHTLPAIARALVQAGMAAETALASVVDAGLPTQSTVVSTVGAVAAEGAPQGLRAPAVTVIGHVAAFAADGATPGGGESNEPLARVAAGQGLLGVSDGT